jgi:formate-dependent nitrite reductase membrane component NrfD
MTVKEALRSTVDRVTTGRANGRAVTERPGGAVSITDTGTEMRSYYERPILKEPTWKPVIPLYFFTGGLAGGSAALGLAARAGHNERLARACLYTSFAAELVSPPLLIKDLGRPERFLNMFRVFKPTSPMSVGSWLLGASGGVTSVAALLEATHRAPRTKVAAEGLSAVLGLPLATYTGVLVANTAIPAWHDARRELPFLFGASALATAGGAATVLVPPSHAGPARRAAVGAAAVEVVLSALTHRRIGLTGEAYRTGTAARLGLLARVCSLGGVLLLGRRGRRSRGAAVAGGSLVVAGGLAMRFAVMAAGRESARNPRYVVEPQRQRRQVPG